MAAVTERERQLGIGQFVIKFDFQEPTFGLWWLSAGPNPRDAKSSTVATLIQVRTDNSRWRQVSKATFIGKVVRERVLAILEFEMSAGDKRRERSEPLSRAKDVETRPSRDRLQFVLHLL